MSVAPFITKDPVDSQSLGHYLVTKLMSKRCALTENMPIQESCVKTEDHNDIGPRLQSGKMLML